MLSLTSLKKGGFVKLVAIFFSAYETITEFKQPKIIYFVITISESKTKQFFLCYLNFYIILCFQVEDRLQI